MNLAIQAAGHKGAMVSEDGSLFIKPNTKRWELEAYEVIRNDEDLVSITWPYMGLLTEQQIDTDNMPKVEKLADQVKPADKLRGELNELGIKPNNNNEQSDRVTIVLGSATYKMVKPSILDVKLGSLLYDERENNEEKKLRLEEVSKSTTSGSLDMRVAGMQVWDCKEKEYKIYDKAFGREIKKDEIVDKLDLFFVDSFDIEMKRAICEGIVDELAYIQQVLRTKEMRFISSSVLIVYESDPEAFEQKLQKRMENMNDSNNGDDENEDDEYENSMPPLFNVKLIDFTHTRFTPSQGPDLNVLCGLKNLESVFEQLQSRAAD